MAEINSRAYEVDGVEKLLTNHNDGDDLARLNIDYRRVVASLSEHIGDFGGKAAAELNVKIKFVADPKGVEVTIESTRKIPKRPTNKSRYFATQKGDGLTVQNPNRGTMFPGDDLGRRRAGDPS